MELDRSDVIQVTEEREKTAAELVVPDFDFVIVTAGDDEWFKKVKVDPADWPFVFFEAVNDGSHAIVPSLLDMRRK
jgi:hypothetical protein